MKNRNKGRKSRTSGQLKQDPASVYYLIVTDGEKTEKNYFEGLRNSLPEAEQKRVSIKVITTSTKSLLERAIEYASVHIQYSRVWIVLDRDLVPDFDTLIDQAVKAGVEPAWTNPCIETWFSSYFGQVLSQTESRPCNRKFNELYKRKTGKEYNKAEPNIYAVLNSNGDEHKAIEISESKHKNFIRDGIKKPSDMVPCTTVYSLIKEIKKIE